MRRLLTWLGWTVAAIALLYGFAMLGSALWLRQYLNPDNLAASPGCWGQHDSLAKAARSQASRDRLVLYVLRLSPAMPRRQGPGPDLREVLVEHVYLTWWPIAERERLFAATAPGLRPCRFVGDQLTRSAG